MKTETLMFGGLSKQTSQLAVERSRNPKIKEFAEFEIDEQTTMAQVLTDKANPSRFRSILSMPKS